MAALYNTYNAEQFLDDPTFVSWIKYGGEEKTAQWEAFENSNPPNIAEFNMAVQQLKAFLSVERVEIAAGESDRVWTSIEETLLLQQAPVKNIGSHKWWWAAAVVLVAAATTWYFSRKSANTELAETKNKPTAPVIKQASTVPTLTLADGSTILLDSSGKENIATQGNTKVINIDGTLAYRSQGKSTELVYNAISTPRGQKYQVVLADGTRVWLNAMSTLRFPVAFSGNERRVEIEGEAWFDISQDAKRPFIVQHGDHIVTVLGTTFNINAYRDEPVVAVTLLNGKVKVGYQGGTTSKLLQPGQQVQITDNGLKIAPDPDLQKVTAWKDGYFSFRNDDIQSIMRQLSRWYDLQVSYEGNIPAVKFSGELGQSLSLSQVLSALSEMRIHYRQQGNKLIVMP